MLVLLVFKTEARMDTQDPGLAKPMLILKWKLKMKSDIHTRENLGPLVHHSLAIEQFAHPLYTHIRLPTCVYLV